MVSFHGPVAVSQPPRNSSSSIEASGSRARVSLSDVCVGAAAMAGGQQIIASSNTRRSGGIDATRKPVIELEFSIEVRALLGGEQLDVLEAVGRHARRRAE